MLQLFISVLFLVALSGIIMAFNLIFRKKDFPDTHVGHNPNMKKKGIVCVKTFDKQEQLKANGKGRFQNLRVASEN